MKLRKVLFLTSAIAGGLLLLVVILALLPPVQTALANSFASKVPGMTLRIERVAAGFGGINLRNLSVERAGIKITVDETDVRAGLLSLAFGGRTVDSVTIKGAVIDLSETVDAEPRQTPDESTELQPLRSLIRDIAFPAELSVGPISMDANVLPHSAPMGITRRVSLRITSPGISLGQESKLQIDIADADPLRDNSRFRPRGSAVVLLATSEVGKLTAVSLLANLTVVGPNLNEPLKLNLSSQIRALETDESLSLVLRGAADSKDLVNFSGILSQNDARLRGDLRVNVETADLAAIQLNGSTRLPRFTIDGAWAVDIDPMTQLGRVAGRLGVLAGPLDDLDARLRPLGVVQLEAGVDVERKAQGLRIADLSLLGSVAEGTRKLLDARVSRALTLSNEGNLMTDDAAPGPIAQVRLSDIDMPLLSALLPGVQLQGSPLSGELAVRVEDSAVVVSTERPFTLRGLSVVVDGQALLAGVDVIATVDVRSKTPDLGFSVNLKVQQQTPLLAELKVQGTRPEASSPLQITFDLFGDFAHLGSQPALAEAAQLRSGNLWVQGSAEVPALGAPNLTAQVTLNRLSAHRDAASGSISTTLDVGLADTVATLQGQLRLQPAEGPELPVALESSLNLGESRTFTASVSGGDLRLEAIQALLAGFVIPSVEAPEKTAETPGGTSPPWAGTTGDASVRFKSIDARGFRLEDVDLVARISDQAVRLERLRGSHAGKPVEATAELLFDATSQTPYRSQGTLKTSGFDLGSFLASRGEDPLVSGLADVDVRFNASGTTLDGLADAPSATVKISGTQGNLRLLGKTGRILESLAKNYETVERGASIASQAAGLAGALGLLKPADAAKANELTSQAQARVAEGRRYRELVEFLASVPFENFSLDASLESLSALRIDNLQFVSSVMQLTGRGSGSIPADRDWQRMPVDLALALEARGSLASLLPADKLAPAVEGAEWRKLIEPLAIRGNLRDALQEQVTQKLLPALLK